MKNRLKSIRLKADSTPFAADSPPGIPRKATGLLPGEMTCGRKNLVTPVVLGYT